MSSSALIRTLGRLPMPLFGTQATATMYVKNNLRRIPPLAGWILPAVVGGMWFIWPAVDEEWKQSVGMGSSRGGSAAAAEPQEESKPQQPPTPPQLDEAAKAKIKEAHLVDALVETPQDKAVSAQIQEGDFSTLENEWDTFLVKSIAPGEDDDDDDEDDEDDEEDEDEEGDDEEEGGDDEEEGGDDEEDDEDDE